MGGTKRFSALRSTLSSRNALPIRGESCTKYSRSVARVRLAAPAPALNLSFVGRYECGTAADVGLLVDSERAWFVVVVVGGAVAVVVIVVVMRPNQRPSIDCACAARRGRRARPTANNRATVTLRLAAVITH